ncbi:tetratricopeptide repeat protein [Pseudomonas japonica]|uniref:Tfp pilus assembly protein PilF n=1 Tax=Pseudomonas japonica TaxID=256466 RepID=A0A239L5B4_9PSED|nr:tetratricopeptide repeat protein [Pseudomonas japonica]SNT24879.1 Tfp pilus assembly protein PilF [Pseudomonas japonica]
MTTDTPAPQHDRLVRLLGFLSHDPTNPALLADALNLAIETGDLSNGKRLLDHLEQHHVDTPQLCALALHLALQAHDFGTAAAYGDKAVNAGIEHPAVIYNAAFAHFYSGDYVGTADLFARHAGPQDSSAALLLHARALHHQELTEEAEPLVEQALQQEPDSNEARGLLALLRYENDDLDGALRLARDVLVDAPDQLDALIACASAHFEQRDIAGSRSAWQHTVQAHPQCGRAWSGLGQLEFNELQFDQALQHLRQAVEFMPDHIGTWHLLAWIHILRNDSHAAREALLKSYELDRNFGETHGGLAVVDIMDGLEEEGRFGIRRALKLNPDGLGARYAEMLLLQRAGKAEEAADLVRQVLAKTSPDGHNSGQILLERWLREHQDNRGPARPDHH